MLNDFKIKRSLLIWCDSKKHSENRISEANNMIKKQQHCLLLFLFAEKEINYTNLKFIKTF